MLLLVVIKKKKNLFEWYSNKKKLYGCDLVKAAKQSENISNSDISRVYLGRMVQTLKPWRCHHGWRHVQKFSKFVPPDTLKMQSWLCFLKNSDIQIKNLYEYKLVRVVRQLGLEGITRSSVNYLCKRKSEYSRDLLCS